MNRIGQFLRSVLPADPFQVCFLAGLVCFTIAPHLRWWPAIQNDSLSIGVNGSLEPMSLQAVRIIAGYGFILASSAGYFLCMWPGKRSALKVGLLVLTPAIVSMGSIIARILNVRSGGYSIVQQTRGAGINLSWAAKEIWPNAAGIHFAVFGVVLVGVFWIRQLSGRSSQLPVTLKEDTEVPAVRPLAWEGTKRLTWYAAAPLATILTVWLSLSALGTAVTCDGKFEWQRVGLGRLAAKIDCRLRDACGSDAVRRTRELEIRVARIKFACAECNSSRSCTASVCYASPHCGALPLESSALGLK